MTPINVGTSSIQCMPNMNIPIMYTISKANMNHKNFTWSLYSAKMAKELSGTAIDSNIVRSKSSSRARNG